jgi:hypothetical protein
LTGPEDTNRQLEGVMAATVVCISRTDGSLGEFVGVAVASELVPLRRPRGVVARRRRHVDRATIADAERRKSFVGGCSSPAGPVTAR